ncbi:MAG: S-layer homology domain-containing protein, partial [Clostridiales bacterium]|nr:S-layer homology domain-containing protein [Clostridiales bacterium]
TGSAATYTTSPAEDTILSTPGTLTVTVSFTEDGVTKSSSFSISVAADPYVAPEYRIALDVSSYTFPDATVGYSRQNARSFTLTNSGNRSTGELTISISGNASAFVLSGTSIDSVAAGYSASFAIEPAFGLPAGVYHAIVAVSGDNGITAALALQFTVRQSGGSYEEWDDQDSGSRDTTRPETGQPGETEIPDSETPLSGTVENPFEDVREGDWFYDDVLAIYARRLMIGTSTQPMLFSPNVSLSRAMIVAILHRMEGSPDPSGLSNPFTDVAEGAWYAGVIKWAASKGIVVGYGGGLYGPDDPVTREQLSAILSNYASYAGISLPEALAYPDFLDESSIADYAKESVRQLSMAGIIGGKPGNIFDPKGHATRAETAAMLLRLLSIAEADKN